MTSCKMTRVLLLLCIVLASPLRIAAQQQDWPARRAAAVAWIEANSDREQKVMIPLRDGTRLSSVILFPKGKQRQNLPAVLFFSPYLLEPGEIARFADYVESFLRNGYAAVFVNVRGRYFSEGTYTYLGGSEKDGYDTVDWITRQPWSNGKVGTLGCSSTAEEQHRLVSAGHPGLAAAVPISSGAGIGKVGPYNEMGNWYRGGVMQPFWFSWYYGSGYTYKPSFPKDLPRETMVRLGRLWNLQPTVPPSGIDTLVWMLPLNKVMDAMQGPPSDLDRFINRLPNDPAWKATEFGGEGNRYAAPALFINAWYDVSIGPNVAMYEYQVHNAANEHARENMFMVNAPTTHCQQGHVESEHTVIGQRDIGDARFDYVGLVQRWFDHFLRGIDNGVTREPKVRSYIMGLNEWQSSDTWPRKDVVPTSFYLASDGGANSLFGNGRLTTEKPARDGSDSFTYDPLNPVPSLGGSICCFSASQQGGAFDQSKIEARNDVLVYTSQPLTETLEINGSVEVSLYLSSDVKDTDLTVKLLDVYPDGRAFNLDESIQRVRWREGYEKPVFMEKGKVYKVDFSPLVTGNAFLPGHRIRIEVSSSNFPRFERNLNTGGNNYDEKDPVVAHNRIHHSLDHPSRIVLPVVRKPST